MINDKFPSLTIGNLQLTIDHFPLIFLLCVYFLVGALYAFYTPNWQAPDEPAHYNYVKQLANGRFPRMQTGDYDEATKNEIISSHFAAQYSIDSFTYEDWQPPLYYLLLTPIFWFTGGSLLALRLFSVLLGAGVILLAYLIAQEIFYPSSSVPSAFIRVPSLVLGTAVFVAFLPQHVSILASVNNDALAELLIAAILYLLLREIRDWRLGMDGRWPTADRRKIALGILLGLGFLTKGTVYPLALIIALTLLLTSSPPHLFTRSSLPSLLLVFTPALLLGGLWWLRNIAVYGGLDILGKAAHDAVVIGQPRTADWIAQMGWFEFLRRFLQTTFHSFWGQFGWMAVPMPGWVYWPLGVFSTLVIVGLIMRSFRGAMEKKWSMVNGQLLIVNESSPLPSHSSLFALPPSSFILLATFLLTLAVYLGYNLTFVQHQGRYLFPALIPIGIGAIAGLEVWIRPFAIRWPVLYYLLPVWLGVGLAGLDVLALFWFIVPNL